MKIKIITVKKSRPRESQTRLTNGSRDTRWESDDEKGTCTNTGSRYHDNIETDKDEGKFFQVVVDICGSVQQEKGEVQKGKSVGNTSGLGG